MLSSDGHEIFVPTNVLLTAFYLVAFHLADPVRKMEKKRKLGTYAMKRVAAGAHLPTPWLFEPAKRPDDRADYCLDCSFLP